MTSVAICDDHVMVREALASVFNQEEGLRVVGISDSISSTRDLLSHEVPDVLIVDVRLDGESGLDVAKMVIAEHPQVKVVVLTSFNSDEALVTAYELGASAFVLKTGSSDDLIQTIRDVASGMRLINAAEVRSASESLEKRGLGLIRKLDANDRHIARLIAMGYSDKQIAETVYLGLQTVRNRVSRMLSRFDKENRTQLALFFSEYQGEISEG
ncbi:MAG: response regulator transcription factor [Ilumatobacteraceae bacterium]|jgi:DNA-binding NarL/FixJ family response regulator|nr:response regulator transcription factor [Ilumatobacteraceae bacterium]